MTDPVRAVLWDADGVLQHGAQTDACGTWEGRLDALGGPGFGRAVIAEEMPALRGEEPLAAALDRVLALGQRRDGITSDLLDLWTQFTVDRAALALVDEVRARGVICVLATNQQDFRRELMRPLYDDHFDVLAYSCEVRAAKPDPAYFTEVLAHLGLPSAEVGFIDDSAANVAAASSLGIRALRHDPASGMSGLRRHLATLGWG